MALGEERFVGLAADFEGKLRMKNAILFIGRNMKEDVVRQIIGLYPWKIIATSRNTLPLEELQGIHIKIYSDEGDITAANLWKNDEFPVVYVWKKDESLNEEECQTLEITGESEEEYRVRRAQGMMKRLCKMIDNHNAMVVVGYAPETDNDMPYRAFATAVYNDCAIADNIQFWSEKSEETKLKKLADLKGIEFHTESLDEVLKARYEWNQSDEVKSNDSDAQYEIFYKNGKAVTISSREFLPYRKLAFVLTEQKVFAVRPYGKVMQAKWFYNFLIRSSADGPQWYGYLKNSDFHVSREFEIVLKCAVKRELLGEAIAGADKEMPIILCGAPGSSKSVALAALAYEIYSEHNNPVIFIDNDTLLFSDKSEEGDALKTLMEKIDACDGDARILLIWDCSSYRNVTSNAQHLSQMLLNRGRRFVLVCSAYETPVEKTSKRRCFSYIEDGKKHFVQSTDVTSQMFLENGCCYINTDREMNTKEKNDFWEKIKTYSGIENQKLQLEKKNLQDQMDIFQCFYRIINLLRPNLERALGREELMVNHYVVKQLDKTFSQENTNNLGSIAQAFIEAGLSREEMESIRQRIEKQAEESSSEYNLEKFNACIALFGRFKLEVPYAIAVWMLKENSYEKDKPINVELYNVLTTRIPWIHYSEMKDGSDYAFSFRNPLEAEIFLSRNGINANQQVELLCEILRVYQEHWEELPSSFARNLQQLIRLMGPNSQYTAFRENGEKRQEHSDILRQSEKIVQTLRTVCNVVPDRDAGFATLLVTYSREYYGKKWEELYKSKPETYTEESYEKRIKELEETITFANRQLEYLERGIDEVPTGIREKKYLSDQKNGLIVEITRCNIWLQKNYRRYRDKFGKTMGMLPGLNYRDIYEQLYKAILYSPENGHVYNALFDAFEEVYEHGDLNEQQKLKYLSETKLIADNCAVLEIQNRGADDHDEIQEHLLKIQEFATEYKVTIRDVQKNTMKPEFAQLYHEMIETNQATAVTFVCQQELDAAGVTGENRKLGDLELTKEQRNTCRKVAEFMQEEPNKTCIQGNYFALSLLLRAVWMNATGYRLMEKEGQKIQLLPTQWKEIRRISELCCEAAQSNTVGNRARPIFSLIRALAVLQCTRDFKKCEEIIQGIGVDLFTRSPRMRVPFIYCDQDGPIHYNGMIEKLEGRTAWIHLETDDPYLSGMHKVRYRMVGVTSMNNPPRENEYLRGLILGIGYNGFSAYKDNGQERR